MKRLIMGVVLSLGVTLAVSAAATGQEGETPPTAMDMVEKLKNYHKDPMGTASSIFDTGMLANMRVPIEHLRVSFIDLRTGEEIRRDDRRHILGQSRQDGMHEMIREAFATFSLPGSFNQDAMIDVFDAAAIASMRVPPTHVSVEFYDTRKGPTDDLRGGISGRVPDYVYNPSENTLEAGESGTQSMNLRSAREIIASDWSDENIEKALVDRGVSFTPRTASEFAIVFAYTGENEEEIKSIVLRDFENTKNDYTERNEPFPLKLIDRENPAQVLFKVDESADGQIYIGYVVFSSSNEAHVEHFRSSLEQLHKN